MSQFEKICEAHRKKGYTCNFGITGVDSYSSLLKKMTNSQQKQKKRVVWVNITVPLTAESEDWWSFRYTILNLRPDSKKANTKALDSIMMRQGYLTVFTSKTLNNFFFLDFFWLFGVLRWLEVSSGLVLEISQKQSIWILIIIHQAKKSPILKYLIYLNLQYSITSEFTHLYPSSIPESAAYLLQLELFGDKSGKTQSSWHFDLHQKSSLSGAKDYIKGCSLINTYGRSIRPVITLWTNNMAG